VDKEDIVSIFNFGLAIDRSFVESGLAALSRQQPDLTLFYLNGLDAAEHHFWKYIEPEKFPGVPPADVERFGKLIDEYYVYMDEVLGQLLARYPAGDVTVIVVSDHGHEANEQYAPSSADHFHRVCSGSHEHAPDGVLIMAGPRVVPGARFGVQPNIFDVAPTVLALLGLPVGEDMPGRVLTEAIDPAFLSRHPVTTVKTHSAERRYSDLPVRSEMGAALKEKLKGIGYIR
jgi:predicted AlkP superfamily phosphohydrolase/phosphomutase